MMPLHRRQIATKGSKQFRDNLEVNTPLHSKDDSETTGSLESNHIAFGFCSQHKNTIIGILILFQVLLLMIAAQKAKIRYWKQSLYVIIAVLLVSLPIFMSLAVGLGLIGKNNNTDFAHQRYIPLAVVATVIGNQLPFYLSCAIATIGLTWFGLASRPVVVKMVPNEKDNDQKEVKNKESAISGPLRTILATMLMIAVLLTENFFVWVVSATYKPSYEDINDLPTPLQDNGQLTIQYVINQVLMLSKRDVVGLRNMIGVEWILVSGLGLSLVAIEMKGPAIGRNLWSIATRAVLTLAAARFIRTVSFLITVLPSQNPRCYYGHFPFPPPIEWSAWILEGLKPQINGGCNDLIISGHATVTSTLACVVVSTVNKPFFSAALWMLLAMDYMVEVYEGFHYSVDMWLGAIMVSFIWRTLAPVEDSFKTCDDPPKQFIPWEHAAVTDVWKYTLPSLVTYIQVVHIIPQDKGNYTIVVFLAAVIFQLIRDGFQHYTQHCLFCLLYLALGVYL